MLIEKSFYRSSNSKMNQKEKKLLFVFLIVLLIGFIAKGIPFALKSYTSGIESVENLKDKRKRLKKLLARSDYWKAEFTKTQKKEQQLEKLLYVGQSPDLMAGRVQSTLKTLTKNSQIKVNSMSLPDLKQYDDWLLITQSMTFKTNSNSLMKLLKLIKKAKPQLIVTDLQIRSQRTTLNCTVKLVAFSRLKSEKSKQEGKI